MSEAKGNCFGASIDFVALHEGWVLAHGIVLGTGGQAKGLRYAHAWAEKGNVVWDHTVGYGSRAVYYVVGNTKHVVRYTVEEMFQQIREHGNLGPWDSVIYELAVEAERELERRARA